MGDNETEACHKAIKSQIEQGKSQIVADLSQMKWLNSRGLGMLIACYTSCKKAGGELRVTGATEKTKSLFMMTKLLEVFPNHNSVEEAISRF